MSSLGKFTTVLTAIFLFFLITVTHADNSTLQSTINVKAISTPQMLGQTNYLYMPLINTVAHPLRYDLPAPLAEQVGNFNTVSRWDYADLTYYFQNGTNDIDGAAERQAVRSALQVWADVTPLTFSEVSSSGAADIIILWGTGAHGDSYPFDGQSGVLAHAFYPPPTGGAFAGDIHFDDAEVWTLNLQSKSGQPIDLTTVAIHEVGHSLGLGHSNVSAAIMYAYYGGSRRQLHSDDIAGIQSLYSSRGAWDNYMTLVCDVNGDGRYDVIWNETANQNRVYVGLASTNGALSFLSSQNHTDLGWTGYETLTGDVNGDGRTDLIWNSKTSGGSTNRIYVGLATSSGKFNFLAGQDHPDHGWDGYETLVGDVNGDGRTDLIWNSKTTAGNTNRIYVGLAQSNGRFSFLSSEDHPAKGWQEYRTLVDDVNGDGRDDLIWNSVTTRGIINRVYVALAQSNGRFSFLPSQDHPVKSWRFFKTLTGDVNGDGRADLIWNETLENNRTYIALARNNGTFQFLSVQDRPEQGWDSYQTSTGDVNGDGRTDLIWNGKTNTNRTYVGLGRSDGTISFQGAQDHPLNSRWHAYKTLGADLTGDGKTDLVWNRTDSINRIYVGRAGSGGSLTFLSRQDHP